MPGIDLEVEGVLLNKKNFGFEDAQKILSAMGYDLIIDFEQLADPADSPKQ